MEPNKQAPARLQSLPQELLGEILSKVGETSAQDFCNAVSTCKIMRSSSANPKVYKKLDLSPMERNPLKAYDNMPLLQNCLDNNNYAAHFIKGMLCYFVEEDQVQGMEHFRTAADGGHQESIYLYGVLLMCNTHFGEGKVSLRKLEYDGGSTATDSVRENLKATLLSVPISKPPESCHLNDMSISCSLCLHYKILKKFTFMPTDEEIFALFED